MEIGPKLTIRITEWSYGGQSFAFTVNFEHITLSSSDPVVDFEQVNVYWVIIKWSGPGRFRST